MQVTIKAHLNKQSRDSKKELIQFYVKGEDEKKHELNVLCREIVELSMSGVESLTAEFVKKSQDSKKTILDFIVKGDTSTTHSYEFYQLAGTDVELTISESQMSIEEFRGSDEEFEEIEGDENQKGLEFKANPDGTVELTADKEEDKPLDPMADVNKGNVVDIAKPRAERVTKTEKAAKAAAEANQEEDPDTLPY